MKIKADSFLVQVKYADILPGYKRMEEYSMGFGWELYLTPGELRGYDPEIISRIKAFFKLSGLPLRLHAPIVPIDYSKIRHNAPVIKQLYGDVSVFCGELGISSVVTHADFDYDSEFSPERQLENAYYLWRDISTMLGVKNIKLNFENHYEREPDYLIGLSGRINSPYVGMCVDVGHFNAFSSISAKNWFKKYPPGSIKEIHLADNNGDGDTHLPLGEGKVSFIAVFEALDKIKGSFIFVLEPRNLDEAGISLAYLKRKGYLG